MIALCTEKGFAHWLAIGTILRGWALAAQGQGAEGLTQIHQGLTAYQATDGEVQRPYYLALLAEAYGKAGQPAEGLRVLTEALALVEQTGEHVWEAELHRLKGELLLNADCGLPIAEITPEACFYHALDLARHQQAKSWELRAATSLARLWQSQDKRQDAYDLLAPVYEWFTEGFDTADLQDAKALLAALEG